MRAHPQSTNPSDLPRSNTSTQRRDDNDDLSCPSGSHEITHQVPFGANIHVCCPGSLVDDGDGDASCCVGGSGPDSDQCIGVCITSTTSEASCIIKVPVTADDYSSRVFCAASSAMAVVTTTSDGEASAVTETGTAALSVLSTSSSQGAAVGLPVVTGVPLGGRVAGGAAVAVLMV